jgi:hypothetical protein
MEQQLLHRQEFVRLSHGREIPLHVGDEQQFHCAVQRRTAVDAERMQLRPHDQFDLAERGVDRVVRQELRRHAIAVAAIALEGVANVGNGSGGRRRGQRLASAWFLLALFYRSARTR